MAMEVEIEAIINGCVDIYNHFFFQKTTVYLPFQRKVFVALNLLFTNLSGVSKKSKDLFLH